MDDMLSQAEIDALLNGVTATAESIVSNESVNQELLTPQEMDAIGEIGNISMGTSATTLFTLLGQKVLITTPKVSVTTWDELQSSCTIPYVTVKVEFTGGLLGTNLLILKEDDVKIITDLMMGGDGTNIGGDLSEFHLSAISEAMNQMIGSSATSISSMFKKRIEISPPLAQLLDFSSGLPFEEFADNEIIVKTAFRMEIGSIVDSEIMQLIPLKFAKELVQNLLNSDVDGKDSKHDQLSQPPVQEPKSQPAQYEMQQQINQTPQGQYTNQGYAASQGYPAGQGYPLQQGEGDFGNIDTYGQSPMNYQSQNFQQPQYYQPMQQMGMQPPMQPNMQSNMQSNAYGEQAAGYTQQNQQRNRPQVNVQPIQFQAFEENRFSGEMSNISMLMDVPLQVTVELGRTHKLIREILELGPGSVIELDKLAGEPVDILVNGKAVAKGEVVVIDESFGVRITDIIHPSKRI